MLSPIHSILLTISFASLILGSLAAVPASNPILQRPSDPEPSIQPQNLTSPINLNRTLQFPAPIDWGDFIAIDTTHAFNFGHTQTMTGQAERNVLAALNAAQHANSQDCVVNAGGRFQHKISRDEIIFRDYNVQIYFDNEREALTYALMGDMLEALGLWVWRRGKTETVFSVFETTEVSGAGHYISNGGISPAW